MRPGLVLKTILSGRFAAFFLGFGLAAIHATPGPGPWVQAQGTASLSYNPGTTTLTWGDGTADNAKASAIYSAFPTITLTNVGDKLTLTGTATMAGITSANGAFRFGVFDENGSSDATGWLGYFVGNAATGAGFLDARTAGNTTLFTSNASPGAGSLQTVPHSTPSSALTAATYTFSFTIERTSASALAISSSLALPTPIEFAKFSAIADVAPLTFSFDRLGFQATSALAADQIQLSGIDVTYVSAIPEPATSAMILAAFCLVGAMARRRLRA